MTGIFDFLEQRGKSIYLHESNFRELGHALDLGNKNQLGQSLRIMRSIHNGRLRSPDTRLTGVIPRPYTEVNLSKLHRLVDQPYFEWAYSRYYRATTAKLDLIKQFDRILTELDVFDDAAAP